MLQYILAFVFFVIAISIMIFALHFSQYKKRGPGCCSGGHCDNPNNKDLEHIGCYEEKKLRKKI
jgi:hypothetical protein